MQTAASIESSLQRVMDIRQSADRDVHYFHTDHLGSVRAITNQSGETIEQNAYYPFGERHTFGNTYAQTPNRFKYNGKEERR